MVAKQEHVFMTYYVDCTCKIQWYTKFMLSLLMLGIVIFIILNARKLKLFQGHLFSNAVKIILFISDAQYYVPVILGRTAGSIHLFKITVKLIPKHIKLKWNILWDVMELDWKEVNMTLNGSKINLSASVIIWLRYKFKIWYIVKWGPYLFHIMLKQGMIWFPLVTNDSPKTAYILKDILPEMACELSMQCDLIFGILNWTPWRHNRCWPQSLHPIGNPYIQKRQKYTSHQMYPWGTQVQPFPSLKKKMVEFMKHRQIITMPFTNRCFQPRPKVAARKHNLVPLNKPNRTKPFQPRKINLGPLPETT